MMTNQNNPVMTDQISGERCLGAGWGTNHHLRVIILRCASQEIRVLPHGFTRVLTEERVWAQVDDRGRTACSTPSLALHHMQIYEKTERGHYLIETSKLLPVSDHRGWSSTSSVQRFVVRGRMRPPVDFSRLYVTLICGE